MNSSEDKFVISGISGRFPESDDLEEFWRNLKYGVQMVTRNEKRWPFGLYDLPPITGRIKNIERIDSEFFELGDDYNFIDPSIRIDHEVIYEAIWDAGLNPDELRGTRVSLLLGVVSNDTCHAFGNMVPQGIPRKPVQTTAAAFGFLGPSFEVDTACASALTALTEGLILLTHKISNAVVVISNSVNLNPAISFGFKAIQMISVDGVSKCLDEFANGYSRSEAVGAMFVQRRKDAKRIHASILSCVTNNDGYTEEGITMPNPSAQSNLMKEAIISAKIDPLEVKYIEAHITGTAAGDPIECGSILEAFRGDDTTPLLIGCLKSNIGHTEGSSGLCAIAKIALIFQNGEIPPNLNFNKANPKIHGLINGRLVPVLHKTKFNEDIIPTNAFGFGGSNVCCILKANEKKNSEDSFKIAYKSFPRLVNICGRTEEQITHTMNWIEHNRHRVTKDFLSLLNDVSKIPFESKMNFRGFMIIDEEYNFMKKLSNAKWKKQELWYMFTGFIFRCPRMAADLMHFEPFAASIDKSAELLKQLHVDLLDVLTKENFSSGQRLTETVIATIAIQLALFDTLAYLGLTPNKIIGVSIGEIVCAVIDGSVTREDMWNSLFHLLKKLEEENSVELQPIIAVEGDYKIILSNCSKVFPVLDLQSHDTQLFSGTEKHIDEYSQRLTAAKIAWKYENLFNLVVNLPKNCDSNRRAMNAKTSKQTLSMKKSTQWLRTMVNDPKLNYDNDSLISALFAKHHLESVIDSIPDNICLVETSCYSVLMGSMKTPAKKNCEFISLFKQIDENIILNVLTAIGNIYNCGHNPEIEKMYPRVEYPVARKTPFLSNLLKWDHSKEFLVAKYPQYFNADVYNLIKFDLNSEEDKFISDHKIDGRLLFPATGCLYSAWHRLSLINGFTDLCPYIQFRDVNLQRAIIAENGEYIKLGLMINRLNGNFVITSKDGVCCTGNARILKTINDNIEVPQFSSEDRLKLDVNSIYKELRVRGYDYGPHFQGLVEMDSIGSHAKVKCNSPHIINILDTLFQLLLFNQNSRDLCLPTKVGSLSINLPLLLKSIENDKQMDIFYEKETNTLYSEAVVLVNAVFTEVSRNIDKNHRLRSYGFIPLNNHIHFSKELMKTIREHNELCSSLTRLLQSAHEISNAELIKNYDNFNGERFELLNSLKKAVKEKQSLEVFIERITSKELNSFPLTISATELIEEQIQICLQQKVSKEIIAFEIINYPQNSSEAIVKDCCLLGDCCCDYHVFQSITQLVSSNKQADIIIYKDISCQFVLKSDRISTTETFRELLKTSYMSLINGGFLLVCCRKKALSFETEVIRSKEDKIKQCYYALNQVINESLFTRIAIKTDDLWFTSILLRKNQRNDNRCVIKVDGQNLKWTSEIKNKLKDLEKKLWLKAKTKEVNGVTGLSKCLREEYGAKRFRCVVQDDDEISEEIFSKDLSVTVIKQEIIGNLAFKKHEHQVTESKQAVVDIVTKGDLTSFRWFEAPHKLWDELSVAERGKECFLVNIYYSALNFKDVMLATNRIPSSAFPPNSRKLGNEYSGKDGNGRRVFGYCAQNCLATTLIQNERDFYFEVPLNWTLQQASTVTGVYATVYYGLIMRGKLLRNETVLIHAGSGGVGQAAIRLCLSMNCEVFTSVGNKEKREKIMELFPQLKERNFVDSRSVSFEEKIMKETNGRGVDVVLNSLSEEKLQASINCLAEGGRFVEIGKYDIINDTPFCIEHKNFTFEVICLSHLFNDAFENKMESAIKKVNKLRVLMQEGIYKGVVQPLHTTIFNMDQIEDAFRFMATGKHFGKVVIKIRNENDLSKKMKVMAVPRAYFYPSKVYIIIGGLGGMGLQLAFWLSERGAKRLFLTTRRGVSDNYQKYMIELIAKNGTEVFVAMNDLCDDCSAKRLLEDCLVHGTIGGIFNLSLILKDTPFDEITDELISEVCKPKITATDLLDKMSRIMCPQIDYFVCFSSVVASYGNAGQTSYAFANSAMEMVCKRRKRDGFHALAIQWGLIADVGVYWEKVKENNASIFGLKPQRIFSCLESLDAFLASENTVCVSTVHPEVTKSFAQSGDFIQQILHILGVADTSNIDKNTTIADLGVDSLMAVEIRQMLQKNFNVDINSQQIRYLSLEDIRNMVNE